MSSKSNCMFTNVSDGRAIDLEVKGDWFDRTANITLNGMPVARITRSFFNVGEILSGRQTVSSQSPFLASRC